jgi:hypothetical protein
MWFSYDPHGDGFTLHRTEQEARDATQAVMAAYSEAAEDTGWPDGTPLVCWGVVLDRAFPEGDDFRLGGA